MSISETLNVSLEATCENSTNAINPKDMFTVEDSLVELAQTATSFMATLVEQESISTGSDSDAMQSVIEGLKKCVLTTVTFYKLFL